MIIFNQGRYGLLKISLYVVSIPSHVTCDGPNATLSLSSFIISHMISKSSSDSKGIIHHFESWHVNLAERRMGPGMPRNGKGGSKVMIDVHIDERAFYLHIIPVLIQSSFVGHSDVFIKTLPVIDPMPLVSISKHFKFCIVWCFE